MDKEKETARGVDEEKLDWISKTEKDLVGGGREKGRGKYSSEENKQATWQPP